VNRTENHSVSANLRQE